MKQLVQIMVAAMLMVSIVGCANRGGPANSTNVNDVQAAGATNNMSYMYRSPPPAAAARLMAVPR